MMRSLKTFFNKWGWKKLLKNLEAMKVENKHHCWWTNVGKHYYNPPYYCALLQGRIL